MAAVALGLTAGCLLAALVTLPFSVADAAVALQVTTVAGLVASVALVRCRAAVRRNTASALRHREQRGDVGRRDWATVERDAA